MVLCMACSLLVYMEHVYTGFVYCYQFVKFSLLDYICIYVASIGNFNVFLNIHIISLFCACIF